MDTKQTRKSVHLFFQISILTKAAISLVEIVGGFVILFIPHDLVLNTVTALTQDEIAENPRDIIATTLLTAAQQFSPGTQAFVVFYLLSRGIVKVFLIGALLKNKLWAYPAMLTVMGLFMISQVYQIIADHSLIMLVLTLVDVVVFYFIWREYRIVRSQDHR